MSQHYSDPSRVSDPHALPNVEVFYAGDPSPHTCDGDLLGEGGCAGWYYWYCFPGCLPDSDPVGPFATEAEALADAREGVE